MPRGNCGGGGRCCGAPRRRRRSCAPRESLHRPTPVRAERCRSRAISLRSTPEGAGFDKPSRTEVLYPACREVVAPMGGAAKRMLVQPAEPLPAPILQPLRRSLGVVGILFLTLSA